MAEIYSILIKMNSLIKTVNCEWVIKAGAKVGAPEQRARNAHTASKKNDLQTQRKAVQNEQTSQIFDTIYNTPANLVISNLVLRMPLPLEESESPSNGGMIPITDELKGMKCETDSRLILLMKTL